MAAMTDDGTRLRGVNPNFLHTNSMSHTGPFSAIAELIDNAYYPDVNAKQIWIDKYVLKKEPCLTFIDNGNGMTLEQLHKMLSFGSSEKVAVDGHIPIGLYGNGFKSGSMRLGKDTIVFTKNDSGMHIGMLSQTFLKKINAKHVIVPIISFNKERQLVQTRSDENVKAILEHSLLATEDELLKEFDNIYGEKGTKIIIWNLKLDESGCVEINFDTDYDMRIPTEDYGTSRRRYKKLNDNDQDDPESDYSLRAYCSMLYLKPRMQIILRGKKVQTKLVSKSLAFIRNYKYGPKIVGPNPVQMTFGYNCQNKEHYGIMMYHKNKLIKSYVRVGCQRMATGMGVGVVGVIECNYLQVTHNKQDFDLTNDYMCTLTALRRKLNLYWKLVQKKKITDFSGVPVEDRPKEPAQHWAQCDTCLKWRKLFDETVVPEDWSCHMNPDPNFRDCSVPGEPEDDGDYDEDGGDDDDDADSINERTPRESKRQASLKGTRQENVTATPETTAQPSTQPGTHQDRKHRQLQQVPSTSKKKQSAPDQTYDELSPFTEIYIRMPENAAQPDTQPNTQPDRLKRKSLDSSPVPCKQQLFTEPESSKLPDSRNREDSDNDKKIITGDISPPKPKSNANSPVPMESLDSEPPESHSMGEMVTNTNQTVTVKNGEDSSNYVKVEERHWQVPNENVFYTRSNGPISHVESIHQANDQHGQMSAVDHEKGYDKKYSEELSTKTKHLEDQLVETLNQQVKEPSDQGTKTDLSPNVNSTKQLMSQYEQALKEINRMKTQCNALQDLKCEKANAPAKEGKDDNANEVDEMALILEEVLQQLDMCRTERDQCKTENEKLKQEKMHFQSQINRLRTEIIKLKEATRQNSASAGTSAAER